MTEAAHAAALSTLPGMGPATLVRILAEDGPLGAWEAVRSGTVARPPGSPGSAPRPPWSLIARRMDPVGWWEPLAARGLRVTWPGRDDYPEALRDDPHPPGVLFFAGDIGVLGASCVAIVGTRSATPAGRSVAFRMGRDLAAAGVCVVSGLALGIDGAAHAGSLAARDADPSAAGPAGVAASGVDVPYPLRHRDLWRRVTEAGVVVSETPPGRPAEAWRFPSRNRVIAGLARMVVVVESHATGGSLITAEAALQRGVEVRVVPGPVHSSASEGSNQLLYDGPGPVRDAQDVLDALGVLLPAPGGTDTRPSRRGGGRPSGPRRGTPRPGHAGLPDDPQGRAVLEAVGSCPSTVGQVMGRTGLAAPDVLRWLHRLRDGGAVADTGGWWQRL